MFSLSNLASRPAIPVAYASREITEVGGLMSDGTDIVHSFYQTDVYVGRILNGAKPSNPPVIRSTKFEFALNLKTAKTLGLQISGRVLALADEVIE